MEKPAVKSLGTKIMKYLPRATTFSIPSRPYSPSHDRRADTTKFQLQNRGFSGPIVSIIPVEARQRKTKTGGGGAGSFEVDPEPTSPKVSCIGQVKHKKKVVCRSKSRRSSTPPGRGEEKTKKHPSLFSKIFKGKVRPERPPPVPIPVPIPASAPSFGQLKRFASSRDTLAGFDWKAHAVEPLESPVRYGDSDFGEEEEDEEEYKIPHSAPMVVGGGGGLAAEQRKEVNLWKRRTMGPPRPLQL